MVNDTEYQNAVDYALQNAEDTESHQELVDLVRRYFNNKNIEYSTFSYADIEQYLPQ